jgi:hypothetical protein
MSGNTHLDECGDNVNPQDSKHLREIGFVSLERNLYRSISKSQYTGEDGSKAILSFLFFAACCCSLMTKLNFINAEYIDHPLYSKEEMCKNILQNNENSTYK